MLYFWKNRFFVKFFVFDIKENILLHFEHQILDVKIWILPWKSIQKIQYLSYCHQFFCGKSFGSIKRNGNCIYTLIVWKLWKIEYFDDCVYVKYSRIFYRILHYTPQKIDICGQKNVFFQKWSKKCKKSKRWDFQKYIGISPKKFEGCRVKIMTCVFFWLQDDRRRQNSFLYSVIWKEPFLRYIFNFFVHFQQSFDFYASYEPDLFTDTNYYVKRSSQIPWTCSHSPLKMF